MNENIILFAILRPPSNASYYCISGYEGGEERGGGGGGLPTVFLFSLKQKFNSNSVKVSTILANIYCGTHIYSTYSLIKMSFGCSFLTCDHVPVLM